MAPKTRIWSAPAYLPGVHPSPSRRKIQRVESILGVTLPPILLEHLKAQNGGHIRFELPGRVHNRIVGLSPSYPSIRTLLENMDQERTNAPLKGLIPFDGDGHWYICLDYNGKPAGAPAVVWVEMDDGTVETIASSFEDYLGMLRIKRAQELLVLDPVPDPQRLLEALGAALGCTFETTTRTYGSGTTHKASVEGPEGPQWLWLQPNEVARAFVYPHENAPYPALAHWLTERRLCHPEISAQGMLMGLGDALRPQVMEACRGLGLEPAVLGDCIKPDWEH